MEETKREKKRMARIKLKLMDVQLRIQIKRTTGKTYNGKWDLCD